MKTILLISAILVLVLGFSVGAFCFIKIKLIRKKYLIDNATPSQDIPLSNENNGDILAKLKRETYKPLQDVQLIYAINTILRNGYKKTCLMNFHSAYEEQSFKQLAKQEISCVDYDFLILKNQKNLENQIIEHLSNLKDKKMFFIVNINSFSKNFYKIKKICKINNLRYNYELVGKGIFIIAK